MSRFGSGRGIGVTEAIHGAAEWPVVLLFGLVTQLGDVWFLLLLGGCLYVAGPALLGIGVERRRGLFVLALVLVYVALVGAVKTVFQSPRPPGAGTPPELSWLPTALVGIVEGISTAHSPGFPSGHALGSTLVWGGLALVLERWPVRRRAVLAGGAILLVSLSRLVLGVHYLVDVVAGIGLGAVVLGVLYGLSERGTDPGRVLLAAVAVGVAGLLVDVTFDSVAAAGGAVGGWLAWRTVVDATPARPRTGREVLAGVLGLGAGAALVGGLVVIEPPLVVTFLGTAVAAGATVGAPLVGRRLA